MGGGFRDAESVVGAPVDDPEDGVGGIGEEELVTLLEEVDFEVGEEITQQTCFSTHSERSEPVARRRLSHMEREYDFFCIESHHCGLFGDDEVFVHRFSGHPQFLVLGKHIASLHGDGHWFERRRQRPDQQLATVEHQLMCGGSERRTRAMTLHGQENVVDGRWRETEIL